MYLRKNFWLAASSEPPYSATADSDSAPISGISQRTGFQPQPSAMKVGAASTRIAFS